MLTGIHIDKKRNPSISRKKSKLFAMNDLRLHCTKPALTGMIRLRAQTMLRRKSKSKEGILISTATYANMCAERTLALNSLITSMNWIQLSSS